VLVRSSAGSTRSQSAQRLSYASPYAIDAAQFVSQLAETHRRLLNQI